jgi:1,4-alpha-glucan branching enzyme
VVSSGNQSTLSFLRKSAGPDESLVCVFNFTAEPRHDFRIGVEAAGFWHEVVNTDAKVYCGSGLGNQGGVHSTPTPSHGRAHSLSLTLPSVHWGPRADAAGLTRPGFDRSLESRRSAPGRSVCKHGTSPP